MNKTTFQSMDISDMVEPTLIEITILNEVMDKHKVSIEKVKKALKKAFKTDNVNIRQYRSKNDYIYIDIRSEPSQLALEILGKLFKIKK